MNKADIFKQERQKLNDLVMDFSKRDIKRFYNLDTAAYKNGFLDSGTKELLGLSASMVLRCDDCIAYHLNQCFERGITDDELEETLNIGLIVGGSIVIPHLRRAISFWKDLLTSAENAFSGDFKQSHVKSLIEEINDSQLDFDTKKRRIEIVLKRFIPVIDIVVFSEKHEQKVCSFDLSYKSGTPQESITKLSEIINAFKFPEVL